MTYHIKVRFRVDPNGLVTSAQITQGSGNGELDTDVLSAARRMSFACKEEAPRRQVVPGKRVRPRFGQG